MSRFIRSSKYRHVYGQGSKRELCFDNIKLSSSAWDTNLISASASYLSVNWNTSGGGAFAILPLPSPFAPHTLPPKLPDILPLARGHTAPVLDTDWSPHDDALVASAGDDGQILLWKVEENVFEGWSADKWEPRDFDPVLRIGVSTRRVGQVLFHPIAKHVVAGTTGEHNVKLFDIGAPEEPQRVLGNHPDPILSFAFDFSGNLIATTCRDRKLRLFDARAGGDAIRVADGHSGVKGSRIAWMGNQDRIVTTGFGRMSDRQLGLWEAGQLRNIKMMTVDQSAGVLMPFYSDNNIVFVAGKGDGNIRYYEYENDNFFPLSEYQSTAPQRGMCFLPRRALNMNECEIARAYKVAGSQIEPIAFVVPRKSDAFQADIYPPALAAEPAMSAGEFFTGKVAAPKLISLESGAISSSHMSAAQLGPISPAITKTTSSTSVSAPVISRTTSAPEPAVPAIPEIAKPIDSLPKKTTSPPPLDESLSELREENANLLAENEGLTEELRKTREQIRELELQIEKLRANARRATELLG